MEFETVTLARAYQSLRSGEAFWLAIGEFMNSFFLYEVENRQYLLDDPLETLEEMTEDEHRWSAFLAGAAEYLAEKYELRCPEWAMKPEYSLEECWYLAEYSPAYPAELLEQETPEPFRRRRVICGKKVFSNPRRSSREPGNFAERRARLRQVLEEMEPGERDAYVAQYNARVPSYMRLAV